MWVVENYYEENVIELGPWLCEVDVYIIRQRYVTMTARLVIQFHYRVQISNGGEYFAKMSRHDRNRMVYCMQQYFFTRFIERVTEPWKLVSCLS